jgi:RHS repeat-associated protein
LLVFLVVLVTAVVSTTSAIADPGVAYKYNREGKPIEITYPNHKSITRVYDKYGRLQEVTDWNSRTIRFTYDSNSNLTAITFPSETDNEDRYTYDGAGELSGVTMLRRTEVIASLRYARDADGQVTLASSQGLPGGEAAEYVYGEDDRLVRAGGSSLTRAGGTEYAYDNVGNPTRIGNDTYTYNSADELLAGAGITYAYNAAGQRIEAAPAHGAATTYGYDQAGNLLTVQRPASGREPAINDSYTYDSDGLRSSQTIDGRTSNLTWDTAEELPLLLSDATNSYIYGPGGLPIEQISNTGATLYFHHDQQGSTRLLTNIKGEVEGAYTYSPYGELTARTGAAATPLLYDGQYTDTDTGLIYLRARSYDPVPAQFLSIDPDLEATHEPYAYTGDDPLNRQDPAGCQWLANVRAFLRHPVGGGLAALGVGLTVEGLTGKTGLGMAAAGVILLAGGPVAVVLGVVLVAGGLGLWAGGG